MKLDPDLFELLGAFSGQFERIGVIAERAGYATWHPMQKAAEQLCEEGMVERRFVGDCHRYRLTPGGLYARQTGDC